MKNLSTVTARIVRENEQYKYKIKGKGEKYLVIHEEGKNAGDIVAEYLSPFAKEPVKIEQTALFKGRPEIINKNENGMIFQAKVEYISVDENKGKERKITNTYFVQASHIREAFEALAEFISDFVSDACITSVSKTKIIEVLGGEEDGN